MSASTSPSTPPFHPTENPPSVLTYEQWSTVANQDKVFSTWTSRRKLAMSVSQSGFTAPYVPWANPYQIDPLWCCCNFPRYEKTGEYLLRVDDTNIMNGRVLREDVEMYWCGYLSHWYNGDLQLAPLNDASYITGHTKACGDFEIRRSRVVKGTRPGFLEICDYPEQIWPQPQQQQQ